MYLRSSNSTSIIVAPSKRIWTSTTLSLVGISRPCDGGVAGDGGLAVGGGGVVAGLRALERAVLDGEGGDDLCQDLGGLGALEVVGEEEFLLLGDRLGRHLRQIGGEGPVVASSSRGRIRRTFMNGSVRRLLFMLSASTAGSLWVMPSSLTRKARMSAGIRSAWWWACRRRGRPWFRCG